MRKNLFTTIALLATYYAATSQNINPPANMSGGEYVVEHSECITNAQREEIKAMLNANVAQLIREGKINPQAQLKAAPPKFKWPLKELSTYDYKYCYGISNYIDHNPAFPNLVQDYNCGNRTYDNSNGYNHAGTDIFLWPFSWLQMQRKQVKIVAAAPGIIIGKTDGNFDKSCGFNSNNWNAVYVQHADGSVAWYGHMKKNTVTSKNVGDAVALNEKLGNVGSSGNSTGPHLHFEVYDANNVLVDPWKGSCNSISSSWWSGQKPYYESKLNTILIHNAAPVFPSCPATETPNESYHFTPGSVIYFASYYHDQLAGQVTSYKVTRPDNSVYASWTGVSTAAYYAASYWYWYYTLPSNAPFGTWKYQAVFQGDTLTRTFTVAAVFAPKDLAAYTVNVSIAMEIDFYLSPNPASDNLKIETDDVFNHFNYNIFDSNGKLCKQGLVEGNENNISIEKLSAGIYCIQVTDENGTSSAIKKFVKQ